MKKTLALVMMVVTLTACGSKEPPPIDQPQISAEQEFLYDLDTHGPEELKFVPDEQKIKLARQICESLDNGVSLTEILRLGDMKTTGALTAAAVVNFCPHHLENEDLTSQNV